MFSVRNVSIECVRASEYVIALFYFIDESAMLKRLFEATV
jgi:hypothetical protein